MDLRDNNNVVITDRNDMNKNVPEMFIDDHHALIY